MTVGNLSFGPVGEVLNGLDIMRLPEGDTPLEVVAVIKAIDSDGDVVWLTRYTKGPTGIEFLGALQTAAALLLEQIKHDYTSHTDEDE